ncbi:MAG TPA: dihydrofolate reductase family protein, partial [Burkholderiales bacterium]|nr:dihydrofolate reductase family protein [Burkholderiales bacterium]
TKIAKLMDVGAKVMVVPDPEGKVELPKMMETLAKLGMNEVLVEGGFRLNGSLLKAGLVDELLLYLAPHLLGDKARGMFELPELQELAMRRELQVLDLRTVGRDLRMLARFADSG